MPSTTMTNEPAIPGGVWCPVISLYKSTPRQELDLEASLKYFTYLCRSGIHGLVLQGSTAEAALLSPEERIALIRVGRQAASDAGRPELKIMAGISGQSTNETLRLAEDAAEAGADFGLLLPPSYWPKAVGDDVIVEFYQEVAGESRIPIVIYNFPGVTSGIDLNLTVLSKLAVHPNILGVKLTCANAGKVSSLTSLFPPSEFSVFSGQSDWLLPCLISGGVGCVTGIGNVFPRSVVRLYDLWMAGKVDEAKELQGRVARAEFACKKGLAATKFGTGVFAGKKAGLMDADLFLPRKPYKGAGKDVQKSTIEIMQILAEFEDELAEKA